MHSDRFHAPVDYADAPDRETRPTRGIAGPGQATGAIALHQDALTFAWGLRPQIPFCEPSGISMAAVRASKDKLALQVARTALHTPAAKLAPLIAQLTSASRVAAPRRWSLAAIRALPQSDVVVHDAFFGITRTPDFDLRTIVASQLQALQLLQTDLRGAATRLSDDRLQTLQHGIRLTIGLLAAAVPPAFPMPLVRSAKTATIGSSMRRWLRGHHVFAALSQGLILAFDQVAQADRRGDTGGMITATNTAAEILLACAPALELTGDLPAEHYNGVIRHAMAPPLLPVGFSGLHSRDHRHLVKCMKALRGALEALRLTHPEVQAQMPKALAEVYDSHKMVCAAFVGVDEKSLLMSSEMPPSSIEQLENFKRNRLRLIGGVREAG